MASIGKKGTKKTAKKTGKKAAKKAAKKAPPNSIRNAGKKPLSRSSRTKSAPAKKATRAAPAQSRNESGASIDRWRSITAAAIDWRQAHATLDDAVKGLDPALRGRRPAGLVHSPWELLEHIHFTQADLVDYMTNPSYTAPEWPRQYWPPTPEPPSANAWDDTIAAIHADIQRIKDIALDPSIDLTSNIPWGDDHSYLRTILVAAVHSSYHVAEIIDARRVLGAWNP